MSVNARGLQRRLVSDTLPVLVPGFGIKIHVLRLGVGVGEVRDAPHGGHGLRALSSGCEPLFFLTLDTCPRRPLSLESSDTKVCDLLEGFSNDTAARAPTVRDVGTERERQLAFCAARRTLSSRALFRFNPKPGTRNPEPGTRNPEPGTRNPEPGTRNPEPGIRKVEP